MHELSIAMSLVEAAQEELERRPGTRALAIHIRLGQLSGVVRDALEFSYEVASKNTPLEGSRLVIEEIPVMIDCPACKQARPVVSLQKICCAVCGAAGRVVVEGRDLALSGLEIVENGGSSV